MFPPNLKNVKAVISKLIIGGFAVLTMRLLCHPSALQMDALI